jgi:N-acyl-D-amino-acid deacylase
MHRTPLLIALVAILFSCNQKQNEYDTIIRNGMIYDGNGGEPYKGDIGINGDTIAFIGDLSKLLRKMK